MANRLAGKVAVVAGAGSGIGKGCAEIFAAEGAEVVGVDLKGADYACDLLDEAATNALFADVGAKFGKVDILVNAAAFAIFAWIEDLSYADWKKTLDAELDIVFLPTRAAWPWLTASCAVCSMPPLRWPSSAPTCVAPSSCSMSAPSACSATAPWR